MPPAVVTLAPFRSGSSACAGLIHHLGLPAYTGMFAEGNTALTPKGCYEDRALRRILVRHIDEKDVCWQPKGDSGKLIRQLHEWLGGHRERHGEWVSAKHPTMAFCTRELRAAWGDIRWVVCHRPLDKLLASRLAKKSDWGWLTVEAQKRLYALREEAMSREDPANVLRIEFEDLTADPLHWARTINEWLGRGASEEQIHAAAAFIDPALRNF